jgi:hypothetical protein
VWVVADLGAGDVGAMRVEQRSERTEDTGFGLTAEAEENEVVFAEDRVDDLRDDCVLVSDDPGEERGWTPFAAGACLRGCAKFGDEILAKLVLDAASKAGGGEFAGAERA